MIENQKNIYDFFEYLQINYKIINIEVIWSESPIKSIIYKDMIFPLELGKKSIVDKIYHLEEEDWYYIEESDVKNCIYEFLSCK